MLFARPIRKFVSGIIPPPPPSTSSSLLHFDGTNGSTSFPDVYAPTWVQHGGAQLSTANPKFGSASLLLNGTTDYIQTSDLTDFSFGSADFTVEGWFFNAGTSGSDQTMWSTLAFTPSLNGFNIRTNGAGTAVLFEAYYLNGGVGGLTSNPITPGIWHHVAVVRISGSVSFYVDGLMVGGLTMPTMNSLYGTAMGLRFVDSPSNYFNGYLDEWRVSKSAIYTAPFTPTGPFAS